MKEEYSASTRYPPLGHDDAEGMDAAMTLPDQGDDESLAALVKRMEEIKRNILADYDSAGYDFDGDTAAGGHPLVIEDVAQETSSGDAEENGSRVHTSDSNDIFLLTQNGIDTPPQKERVGQGDESSLISATGVSLVDNFNWTEGPDSDPLDNVLERKEFDVIFTTRIRDLAVIFLLILLLVASTVALTVGIVRMKSDKSQPDEASQSDILGQLEDMMPKMPTELHPTETTPSEVSSHPDAAHSDTPLSNTSDVPPSDAPSSNTIPSHVPGDTTSSGQPTISVPSSAPTAFFECKDSKKKKVYINHYWEYQKCKWLAGELRAGTRRRVCRNGFEAFDVCPVTCGRCNAADIEENEDD